MPRTVRAAAAAKLNLYLHVLGRRADGYHLLDSLVAFASRHDLVEVRAAETFRFRIDGPFAGPLQAEDPTGNLVARAAFALAASLGRAPAVDILLTKNLPVASGIGGGSADAAATLRALAILWDLAEDDPRPAAVAPTLGADVPVCLYGRTAYFGSIGDEIAAGPDLPEAWLVLVNPGVAVPTKAVFAARSAGFSKAGRFDAGPTDAVDLARLLATRRNDLGPPAEAIAPEIGQVLAALDVSPGCLFARMSGSGATCFGLYGDVETAVQAAELIRRVRPHWWVEPAALLPDARFVEVQELDG